MPSDVVTEDEGYRTSSQYRYWSFSKINLQDIRQKTNASAAEKVRSAFQNARGSNSDSNAAMLDVRTLSIEEELLIVEMGAEKIIRMGENMDPRVPSNVVATAIQYLRRFYLTNSPMMYHPRQIIACALFLAMKANHFYKSLHDFVSSLDNITKDDVKAPEFLLMQALRFTLDVRHPMRSLEGGMMDIHALAQHHHLGVLQRQFEDGTQSSSERIADAANHAKSLLYIPAQTTDAYFLYTPAQIWLGALFAADSELAARYMEHICTRIARGDDQFLDKLLLTVKACAELLLSYKASKNDPQKAKDMKRAVRKLKNFQDPETFDIIALTRAETAGRRAGNEGEATANAQKKQELT